MYKFYDIEDINDLHLEPTTKCNAACPMCLRNKSGDRINNKLVEQDFDLNLLENIDMNIKKLTLAGNYGDPILSNKLFHIIKWFKECWIIKILNFSLILLLIEEWKKITFIPF